MNIRKIFVLFSTVVVFSCFVSCDNNEPLVGSWRYDIENINVSFVWTFAQDGSFQRKSEALHPWMSRSNGASYIIGTYKVKGDKIFLMHDGKIDEWHWEKKGNYLKLGTEMAGYYQLTKL